VDGKQAGRDRVLLRVIPGGLTPGPIVDDVDNVLRARQGDNTARAALFKRHLRMLRQRVHRLMGPDPDAEDMVQEAFLRAFANLNRLVDPQAFPAWLSKIAVHLVNHRLRRRKLLRRLGFQPGADRAEVMDTVAAPGLSPAIATEARRVYALLDELPAEARVAFLLRHLEEMTVPEVSAQMGLSERTVKRRVALAEARMAPFVELDVKERP
jgi:RNA polymerase sigma-70 factor (ECF subfamily)